MTRSYLYVGVIEQAKTPVPKRWCKDPGVRRVADLCVGWPLFSNEEAHL